MAFHLDENIHRDSITLTAEHQTCCLPVKYRNHSAHVLVKFSECVSLDIYEFNHGLTAAQCLAKTQAMGHSKKQI